MSTTKKNSSIIDFDIDNVEVFNKYNSSNKHIYVFSEILCFYQKFDYKLKYLPIYIIINQNLFSLKKVNEGIELYSISYEDMNEKGILVSDSISKITDKYKVKTLLAMNIKPIYNSHLEVNIEHCNLNREYGDRVLNRVKHLCKQMFNYKKFDLGLLDIIDNDEQNKVINEFSTNHKNFNSLEVITDYLDKHAEFTPYKIAASYKNERITYKELNDRSNILASVLQYNGLQKGEIVGLISERSIDMLVSIYGIMKSGGAYLPLDKEQPTERLNYILDNANVKSIIVGKLSNIELLEPVLEDKNVIYTSEIAACRYYLTPVKKTSGNDLAYIIYTSGTTGNPKGVMIKHSSVVNLSHWLTEYSNYDGNTIVLQNFNYIFDGSVPEIFSCCIAGCELQILSEEESKDPGKLLNLLPGKQITMVPSMFREIMAYAKEHKLIDLLNSFDHLFLAAEPVTKELLEEYSSILGNKIESMHNNYGPTEATVCATSYTFSLDVNSNSVPIGKPISNVNIYIVNENKICGIEMIGEICIAGDGLAKGYVNNDKLTKEKFTTIFIPNEVSIYRTGDLGYWDENGNVVFIGRIDDQVKIKGYRVELGEIEFQIRNQNDVIDAVVIADKINNEKVLSAYVIGNVSITSEHIKDKLRQKLPSYMVPSYVTFLDEFPKTLTGKIDKKNLPKPQLNNSRGNIEITNENEKLLINALETVIGISGINPSDKFIDIGGDSIKAIRVVSKLRLEGYELSVTDIMELKVIKDIAKTLSREDTEEIGQGEVNGTIPLTAIQTEFFSSDIPYKDYFNQFVMLKSTDSIDLKSLNKSLNKIVQHHDILRAIFSVDENKNIEQNVLHYKEDEFFELHTFDLLDVHDNNELHEMINQRCKIIQESMKMGKAPLLMVGLFKTLEGDYLMLSAHHLVVDGISLRILIEDLYSLYSSYRNGKDYVLPNKTTSFKDWSHEVEKYTVDKKLGKELNYWLDIEKLIDDSNLDDKYKLPKVENRLMKHREVSITSELTNNLIYDCNKAFNTEINDLLITTLFRSLYEITGNNNSSVCLEGHGREPLSKQIKIDRTIGWFTSVYPIAISGIVNSIEKDIKIVKEHIRRIPNNGVGYGILSMLCENELTNKKPDITFNYLGEFGQEENLNKFEIYKNHFGDDTHIENIFGTGISFNCYIIDKQFTITVSYDSCMYKDEFISGLLNGYKNNLEAVIEKCLNIKGGSEYTPHDFGENKWSIDEFEMVEDKYNKYGLCIESIFPLTPTQEGMLYTHLKNKNSSTYNVQNILSINEVLDINIFNKSLNLLTEKYGVLRTRIVHDSVCEPRQIKFKNATNQLCFIDISDKDSKSKIYEEILKRDFDRQYDFEKEQIIRFTLIKLNKNEYKLLFTFHHIVLDGWCANIIYQDLRYFYNKLCDGSAYESLINVTKYDNVFEIFSRIKNKKEYSEESDYWKNYLNGYENQAMIRSDNKETNSCLNSGLIEIILENDKTNRIDTLCKSNGITMSTYIESIWTFILHRYTYLDDVVFAKVVSGRNEPINGIEEGIGLFINAIPVRSQINKDTTFSMVLESMQKSDLESSRYDGYPLARIQEDNSITISSLFEFSSFESITTYNYENLKLNLDKTIEKADYPLTLSCSEVDGKLKLLLMYDSEIYSYIEAERIFHNVLRLIDNSFDNQNNLLSKLNFIEEKEIEKITVDFNNTKVPYHSDETLISLFDKQVKINGNKLAVKSAGRNLTYKELDMSARFYANKLIKNGMKERETVGILSNHNIETIVSILAVIKAGGNYLPIDDNTPLERAKFMLSDSGASKVLTYVQNDVIRELNSDFEIMLIDYKEESGVNFSDVDRNIQPNDLAYIMYTSGTTGNPKGVMIEQKSVIRLVKNTNYATFNNVHILQMGSLSFDAATFEIWGALLNGGCLTLVEKELFTDPVVLKAIIERDTINTVFITTQFFNHLMDVDPTVFKSLSQILVGGEAMSAPHVKKYLASNDGRVTNIYGPTENTTFSTYYFIDKNSKLDDIPIGYPISNTQVYIFNGKSLCGIGMEGEICLGGEGVARGYLNQNELNDKAFIVNPLNNSERLYRTGDLGRWTSTGEIMYSGRIDNQVKRRGYRIEVKEIEEKLKMITSVEDAAILANKTNGNVRLIAYIKGQENDTNVIKDELNELLPSYMMPDDYVWIKLFPRNKNGKLDKKALSEIKGNEEKEYIEPATHEEFILCKIFCELLNKEKISTDESFFDLGGHSLVVIRLVSKIKQELDISLLLTDIYNNKSVKGIGKRIESLKLEGSELHNEIGEAVELEV